MSKTIPDRLRELAARIEMHPGSEFAGAAFIAAPSVDGTPERVMELFVLGDPDPALFLSTVLSKLQITMRDIEDKQRMQQAFGAR